MLYSSPMRSARSPISWLLVIAMLFAQLATAAYACEQEVVRIVDDNVVVASQPTAMDCDEMLQADSQSVDQATPLCVDHCTHALQAKTDAHAPMLDWSQASLVLVAVLPALDQQAGPTQRAWPLPGLDRAVVPPPPILFGRFHS